MELVLVLYRVVVSRSLSHPKGDNQKKDFGTKTFRRKIISITCLHFEFCLKSGENPFPGSRLDLVSFGVYAAIKLGLWKTFSFCVIEFKVFHVNFKFPSKLGIRLS